MDKPPVPECHYANLTGYPLAAVVCLGSHQSRYTMTVAVKASFELKPGQPLTLLKNQESFRGDEFSDPENIHSELVHGCDLAMWKPSTDLLLQGTCFAPAGEVPFCEVAWQVGTWQKRLRITGDRVWKPTLFSSTPGDPIPFRRMPLTWSRSFGGADVDYNPVGRGHESDLLPNIEYPDRGIKRRGQMVAAAGFGPINRVWAPRNRKLGTYDKQHLARMHPKFPEDFDWTYFNEAPSDQQLEYYLRGDEEISFENLHPEQPFWRTRLPGKRVRVFIADTDESGTARVREAEMFLDTLTVDTDNGVLALVWRGLVPVRNEERSEITAFYVVEESLAEPPKPASVHIADMATAPDLFESKWQEGMAQVEVIKAKTQGILDRYGLYGAVDKALSDPGMTPARLAMFPFTPDGPLPPEVDAETQANLAQAKEQITKAMGELKRMGSEQGVDIAAPATNSAGPMETIVSGVAALEKLAKSTGVEMSPDFLALIAKVKANPGDPFEVGTKVAAIQTQGLKLSSTPALAALAAGVSFDVAMKPPASSSVPIAPAVIQELMQSIKPAATTGAIGSDREKVLVAIREGRPFAGENWTGCDFSGLDLAGRDFSGSILIRTRFSDANIEKAKFIGVTAQDANFSGVRGAGAQFEGSDFTRAQFNHADLTKAQFKSIALSGSCFADACLVQCEMASAGVDDADLSRINGSGMTIENVVFNNCQMNEFNATGATWTLVMCLDCQLEKAVFDRVQLIDVVMSGCNGRGMHFIAADIRKFRAIKGSDFCETVAIGAKADGSTWMHVLLVKANFERASLRGACMMDTWGEGANFRNADLTLAMLRRGRFAQANFQGANLFQAGLGHCDLLGASLLGANCYEADFTDARMTNADLRQARLTRTSLDAKPR